jgi:hypothetical protein
MKAPRLILEMTALGFGFASMASASLTFVNGSFDALGTTTGAFWGASNITAGLAGWTLLGSSGNSQIECVVPGAANGQICNGNDPSTFDTGGVHSGTYYFSLYQYPGTSPTGGNYFLADGDPGFNTALQQTVTGLVIGDLYRMNFWQAAGQENCGVDDGTPCDPPGGAPLTGQWRVTFGSTTLSSTLMTTLPHGLTAWQSQSLTFVATATSQLLSFLAVGTPSGAPPIVTLDGVTITDITAPEPGTAALWGVGLLALGLAKMRKKRL